MTEPILKRTLICHRISHLAGAYPIFDAPPVIYAEEHCFKAMLEKLARSERWAPMWHILCAPARP